MHIICINIIYWSKYATYHSPQSRQIELKMSSARPRRKDLLQPHHKLSQNVSLSLSLCVHTHTHTSYIHAYISYT